MQISTILAKRQICPRGGIQMPSLLRVLLVDELLVLPNRPKRYAQEYTDNISILIMEEFMHLVEG